MKLKDSLKQIDDTWKLNEKLRQVRSRIAELQKKEKYINDQLVRKSAGIKQIIEALPPEPKTYDDADKLLEINPDVVTPVKQPAKRGRRKLNETE